MPVYVFNRLYLGLPHSDISGSVLAASSPELFVGRHVLLRRCVPRYPPSALIRLTAHFHCCLAAISLASASLLARWLRFDCFLLVAMQFSRFSTGLSSSRLALSAQRC